MDVVVAQVGRAHGLRGEVALVVRTDRPEQRLVPGATFALTPGDTHVTVASVRTHQGRWLVTFDEVPDRTAAEALRGAELVVDVSDEEPEDDAWYPSELVGLRVVDLTGAPLGVVTGLEHYPAQDILVVREESGRRTLVPFVRQIVPRVAVADGFVEVDPPAGLFGADADAPADVDEQ